MTDWTRVIRAMAPHARADILSGLAEAMPGICTGYAINTTRRQAHFLAQCAHESDGFRTTKEYASGAAYEGRKDLGNTHPGDGRRFKGRGIIQLTGRSNYAEYGQALGVDLVDDPDLAADMPTAALTAALYWKRKSLNLRADADDIESITRRINGGLNGLADRKQYLARAKRALAAPAPVALLSAPDDADEAPALSEDAVKALQLRLKELGYFPGLANGDMGGATRGALTAFQTDNQLPITGDLDDATKTELGSTMARKRPIAPERANATVDDLRATGSRTIAAADAAESNTSVVAAGGTVTASAAFEWLGKAKDAKDTAADWGVFQIVHDHPLLIACVVVLAIMVWQRVRIKREIDKIRAARLDDHATFRNAG